MKKQSSSRQLRHSRSKIVISDSQFFETFAYPASQLSVFLFIPCSCEFVISLRDSETIVRYRTADWLGFMAWLWKHNVRDISWQVERMLMAERN